MLGLLALAAAVVARQTVPLEYTCRSEFEPANTQGLYAENRAKVLSLLTSENGQQAGDIILMIGGRFETRRGSDTEILFRQYSAYYYMNNFYKYDCSMLVEVETGRTTIFLPRLTESQEIFDGPYPPFSEIIAEYDVDAVAYLDESEQYINALQPSRIFTLDRDELVSEFPFLVNATVNAAVLQDVVARSRFAKSAKELSLVRIAATVSADAHAILQRTTKPGLFEYQIENAFLQYCYACGLRFTSYIPIVGSGESSAILHYNKNDELLEDGDLLLVDAGGEISGYGTDITRTYPVNGKFTADQKLIYNIVLEAQLAAISALKPGAVWGDLNTIAYKKILEGLLAADIVRGADVDTLYAAGVHATFMPHNLGHMVGLDVHDSNHSSAYRNVLVAANNQVWTVEPGVYLIDGLLDQALSGPYRDFYNTD
eukprot:TRINITY_DN2793_c0_g1_i1.p1 TRINITY_DN2793_c0_g1~~TRINITY_DN2793_c0_g1_i1.p1  ORF type:complete len:428 (-),score=96.99 TRINITY_DN2793_c0_g1_i1:361-1644(-)